jgi:hypothetical protein
MAPSPLDYPLDYRAVIQAYPGQIRVTVIRERRAVGYAK